MAAKLIVSSLAFVACTLADPGYYGYGYGRGIAAHPYGGTSYVGRTIWGLRGKRSADAEPGYGYYGLPYGLPLRPVYGPGIAVHPGGATSSTYRSVQGIGKRSADAEPGYGYYGRPAYGYGYGLPALGYYGPRATSYEYRSPQGLGKRSAEAEPGYGYYGLYRPRYSGSYQEVIRPTANSAYSVVNQAAVFEDNFNGAPGPFNLLRGKREAEPGYYGIYRPVGSFQSVSRPGSSYQVNDAVVAANVQEQNANYGAAYAYGFNAGYGK